ncbi:MAG: hypothetical protein E7363_03465 [Clostridiales bacterium]|nr:hypothetical protein [Clostridiales bacterium]
MNSVKKKMLEIFDLYTKFDNMLVNKFFDFESESLLDEKIEVFTALAEGKNESEIPKFYDVLELYPKDGQIWD